MLLAEEKEGMRRMIRILEKYLRGKGLKELNVEKSKILKFRKRRSKKKSAE